jgi:hypothetical protein
MKPVDYTDRRYGKLVAISYTGKRQNNKKRIWLFQCDCGNTCEKPIEKAIKLWVKSCGCLKSTRTPIRSLQHSVYYECYADGTLTEEQFITLASLPCAYCLAPPSNTRFHRNHKDVSFTYSGADRIDNTRPHDFDNVVPCCFECNDMKSDYTMKEFFNKITKIYNNMSLIRSSLGIMIPPNLKDETFQAHHKN